MGFLIKNEKSIVSLFSGKREILTLFVSREIDKKNFQHFALTSYRVEPEKLRDKVKTVKINGGWRVSCNNHGQNIWRDWFIRFAPKSIVFPTREGEFISNLQKIESYQSYKLSYPGSASTKAVVAFVGQKQGVLVCAKPSLGWARISLVRTGADIFTLNIFQHEKDIYIFPFQSSWQAAIKKFRALFDSRTGERVRHKILNKPRFFLQMGVRDFFGRTYIKKFSDLFPFIEEYREKLGAGNVVHLFGTNAAGFDRMFPDFSVDPKLGGEEGLTELLVRIKKIGLYSSHHFNPRIADVHWVEQNPEYKKAIVLNLKGNPWVEFYKNNLYFVMDPNNKKWRNYCLKVVGYFKDLGFDFIELDQIAYQRNLFTKNGGFGKGYQKLIDETAELGIKFWLEGVSDVYDLPADCYFQVLPRDRAEFWETDENRRGYPYGTPFTSFYRSLMPKAPISFQIVTEKADLSLIPKRLALAQRVKACIYDLELGFVDRSYPNRLRRALRVIKKTYSKHAGESCKR